MGFDMMKYERGQVWMIRFKNQFEQVGHLTKKDRPWLILSVGKFNTSSGLFTAVPLTTRDNITTPAQVLMEDTRGSNSVILCEQVRTFDYTSGNYILDYMGTVSDEILEKVDVAMSIHLGLHYSPITLKSLYDSMEAIIKSVGYMQQKAETPVFSDEDVKKFADKLRDLASIKDNDINKEAVANNTPVELANTRKMIPLKDVRTEEHKDTSKRYKWTKEECNAFLEDSASMPMKEVMKKWNISKKMNYYAMKNYVKRKLEKLS